MKLYTFLFSAIFCALFFQPNQSYSQWVKTNGADSGYINCFTVSPNNSGGLNIFAGGYGGIFLSNDNGANWTLVNNGLLTTDVFAIAASAPGTGDTSVFVVTLGVYRSTSNVINWYRIYFGMALTLATNFNINGYTNLFVGTQSEGVKISTDNGANWSEANNGLTNLVVRLLATTSNGENLFASTDGGFFLSTNNGASWTAINNGLTNPTVLALANIDTNLFAGTDCGGLFLSTNNGMNWNEVNTGIADAQVTSLATSGSNLFAVMNSKVYLTTNNGTSWTNINTGLENSYADAILTSGTYIFTGT
ncbi:MAG: regulator, partial [Bacteroidota bacterium]|nr:regulator [Bacteroidota bacterium]